MTGAVIHVERLAHRFGATTALQDVELEVGEGEIYGFLGRNGAGKTTLIRALLGLIVPFTGHIRLFDTSVRGGHTPCALWASVGYIVEGPGLYPGLSVAEHLNVAARYRRLAPSAVASVVERLALDRYLSVRAGTLSLGNRQRLGLALALVHRPPLLILDEPVNGLDPAGVVEVRHLLRELADDGVTVFMSTHVITEASRLADRVGIIHHGRLVARLQGEQLADARRTRLLATFRTPELTARAAAALTAGGVAVECGHDDTSLTSSSRGAIDAPDMIAVRLVDAGAPPTSLTVQQEDLEDFFLHLTEAPA